MTKPDKAVIVDDDLKIIMVVEKTLKDLGFQVFSAGDGKKALELIIEEKPGLVITDILQPGLDGVQLCNKIKEDPELDHIKVILMTGIYNKASFKMQMQCEPDAFIEKPIDMAKLASLVEKAISK